MVKGVLYQLSSWERPPTSQLAVEVIIHSSYNKPRKSPCGGSKPQKPLKETLISADKGNRMELIEDLITVLREEIEGLEGLLLLCEKEKESLVAEDVRSLNQENREQEKLISKLRRSELVRGKITKEIGKILGLKEERFTLSELLPHLQEPYSSRLKQMGERLHQSLKKIQSVNRTNALLLANSLKLIQKKVELLTQIGEGSDVLYSQEGRITPKGMKRRIVDRKA